MPYGGTRALGGFLNLARGLRAMLTRPERLLWARLRARQLGFKFRRQHPLPPYILDFYCAEAHLAVEIDGDSHGRPSVQERDSNRLAQLAAHGIRVLRFTNAEVAGELEVVLGTINEACKEKSPRR